MKALLGLLIISICVLQYNSQVVDRNFDLFFRYWNPVRNFHRSQLYNSARAGNGGRSLNPSRISGTFKVNGGRRSIADELTTTKISCYYLSSVIYCNTTDSSDAVQCDVIPRFDFDVLAQLDSYALGEKRVLSENGTLITKFYMYPEYKANTEIGQQLIKQFGDDNSQIQRPVISLHSTDVVNDNGFTVASPICWNNLVNLLTSSDLSDTITLFGSGETRRVAASLIYL